MLEAHHHRRQIRHPLYRHKINSHYFSRQPSRSNKVARRLDKKVTCIVLRLLIVPPLSKLVNIMASFGLHCSTGENGYNKGNRVFSSVLPQQRRRRYSSNRIHCSHPSQASVYGHSCPRSQDERNFISRGEVPPAGRQMSQREGSQNSSLEYSHNEHFACIELSQMTNDSASYRSQPSRDSAYSLVSGAIASTTRSDIPMQQQYSSIDGASSHHSRLQRQQPPVAPPMHQESQSSGGSSARNGILRTSSHGSGSILSSSGGKRTRFAGVVESFPPSQHCPVGQDDSLTSCRSAASRPKSLHNNPTFSSGGSSVNTNGSIPKTHSETSYYKIHGYDFQKLLTMKKTSTSVVSVPRPTRPTAYSDSAALPAALPRYPASYGVNDDRSVSTSRSERSTNQLRQECPAPRPHLDTAAVEESHVHQLVEKLHAIMKEKSEEFQRQIDKASDDKKRDFEQQVEDVATAKLKQAKEEIQTTMEMSAKKETTKFVAVLEEKTDECEARIDGRTEGSLAKLYQKTNSYTKELAQKHLSITKEIEKTFVQYVARVEQCLRPKIPKIQTLWKTLFGGARSSVMSAADLPPASTTKRSNRTKTNEATTSTMNVENRDMVAPHVSRLASDSNHLVISDQNLPSTLRSTKPRRSRKRKATHEPSNAEMVIYNDPLDSVTFPLPPVDVITVNNDAGLDKSFQKDETRTKKAIFRSKHTKSSAMMPTTVGQDSKGMPLLDVKATSQTDDGSETYRAAGFNQTTSAASVSQFTTTPNVVVSNWKTNSNKTATSNTIRDFIAPESVVSDPELTLQVVSSKRKGKTTDVSEMTPTMRSVSSTPKSVSLKSKITRKDTSKTTPKTASLTTLTKAGKTDRSTTTPSKLFMPRKTPSPCSSNGMLSSRSIFTKEKNPSHLMPASMTTPNSTGIYSLSTSAFGKRRRRKKSPAASTFVPTTSTSKRTKIDHTHVKLNHSKTMSVAQKRAAVRNLDSRKSVAKTVAASKAMVRKTTSPSWLNDAKTRVFRKKSYHKTYSKPTLKGFDDDYDFAFLG